MVNFRLITKFFTILITLSIMFFSIMCSDIILLIGPSCAGKSTLAKELIKVLNKEKEEWKRIDLDECEETIINLIESSNQILKDGKNVIIDTNIYEKKMEKNLEGKNEIIKVLVSAPLEILLSKR
ncbi:ATP-binding cassette domain-containing protein [Candidatus Dependentiae bacterium]|nr:ATP-binding cassette domain-containing protein [Candidatus Dependentiae bacterium]